MSYPLDPAETTEMMSRQIGEWAQSKGFREDWEMADKLDSMADSMLVQLRINAEDCDWLHSVADTLRNNIVPAKLMLAVSELSEALESWRDTGYVGHSNGLGNFMEELADTEIRVKELAHMVGGGIGKAETDKMHKNHDRPHKHGRKM
jgi:NTP pyrophosphatase (non-canonical NTP hydrolase)